MLESAVGGAICAGVATLPNFTYAGDIFPSSSFYTDDLGKPEMVLSGPGEVHCSPVPGIGRSPTPSSSTLDRRARRPGLTRLTVYPFPDITGITRRAASSRVLRSGLEVKPMATRALLTYADYAAIPDDGRRYELHKGSLVMTPAPGTKHQGVLRDLLGILHGM